MFTGRRPADGHCRRDSGTCLLHRALKPSEVASLCSNIATMPLSGAPSLVDDGFSFLDLGPAASIQQITVDKLKLNGNVGTRLQELVSVYRPLSLAQSGIGRLFIVHARGVHVRARLRRRWGSLERGSESHAHADTSVRSSGPPSCRAARWTGCADRLSSSSRS